MSKPLRDSHRIASALAAGCVGLTLAGAAGAVDLRSWDQKINDVTKRFIVLASFNNEAVLDKETQLVWERTPAANQATRSAATQGCMQRKTGGRRGWRLPYFHEMASLADPSAAPGSLALPAGHPFTTVPGGTYWTATLMADSTTISTYGYYVNLLGTGGIGAQSTVSYSYHWCVRGGGPISDY